MNLVKAHAYGNDFLIARAEALPPSADASALARRACDRHRGIGADGLVVLDGLHEIPGLHEEGGTIRMRLLNADGSPSELSGNGIRCAAAWIAHRRDLGVGTVVTIDTDAGPKRLQLIRRDGTRAKFITEMGPPADVREVVIPLEAGSVRAVTLRVGNPQCVVLGPATEERLRSIAAPLAVHPWFPEGTNVELADVVSASEVRILIWERGVGPTESSGTGSCAAAVAAAAYGGADRSVDVVAPGGRQRVEWTADGLRLTGEAELVGEMDWWGV